jgi:hypothetical protein
MADDKTAADYNLEGGATLHLVCCTVHLHRTLQPFCTLEGLVVCVCSRFRYSWVRRTSHAVWSVGA